MTEIERLTETISDYKARLGDAQDAAADLRVEKANLLRELREKEDKTKVLS